MDKERGPPPHRLPRQGQARPPGQSKGAPGRRPPPRDRQGRPPRPEHRDRVRDEAPPLRPGPRPQAPDQTRQASYLNKAIKLLDQLLQEQPEHPGYRQLLALSYREQAMLASSRESGEYKDQLARATGLLEQLAADYPDLPDYRFDLAQALVAVYDPLDRPNPPFSPEEVESRMLEAARIATQLAADYPGVSRYQLERAHIQHRMYGFLIRQDRPREAHSLLRDSLAMLVELAAEEPEHGPAHQLLRQTRRLYLQTQDAGDR